MSARNEFAQMLHEEAMEMNDARASDPGRDVTDEAPPKRGRGRPTGTTGSRAMRAELKDRKMERAEAARALQPVPGSAEYARLKKAELAVERQKSRPGTVSLPQPNAEQLALAAGVGQQVMQIGSIMQKKLVLAWLQNTAPVQENQVVKAFLSEAGSTSSARALSRLLPASAKADNKTVVQRLLVQTGAAVYHLGCWLWGAMLSQVHVAVTKQQSAYKAVAHVTAIRYDETPHKVRVVTTSSGSMLIPHRPQGGSQGSDARWLREHGIDRAMDQLVEASSQAKIMQMQHLTGALMQHIPSGEFCWVFGEVATALAAVDRSTGETTRQFLFDQIRQVPEISRLWCPCEVKLRLSVADRAASNFCAERGLQEPEYMPQHTPCTLACDVHRIATAMRYAVSPVDADASAVLNVGLVCGELGCARALRAILIQILETDLRIEYTEPPADCAQYRQEVHDLYLPLSAVTRAEKRSNRKRRFILQIFLNGDLRSSVPTHFCPWGCCPSEADTRSASSMGSAFQGMPAVLQEELDRSEFWHPITTSCSVSSTASWDRQFHRSSARPQLDQRSSPPATVGVPCWTRKLLYLIQSMWSHSHRCQRTRWQTMKRWSWRLLSSQQATRCRIGKPSSGRSVTWCDHGCRVFLGLGLQFSKQCQSHC